MKTQNKDSGSLHVGKDLPASFHQNGLKLQKGQLQVKIGERTLDATYVMGSEEKGWSLCFAGQGKVPEGEVEFDLIVAE